MHAMVQTYGNIDQQTDTKPIDDDTINGTIKCNKFKIYYRPKLLKAELPLQKSDFDPHSPTYGKSTSSFISTINFARDKPQMVIDEDKEEKDKGA